MKNSIVFAALCGIALSTLTPTTAKADLTEVSSNANQFFPLAIPDGVPSGINLTFDFADVPFTLGSVYLNLGLVHPWSGDVIITLTAPTGANTTLIDRLGKGTVTFGETTTTSGFGSGSGFDGSYVFADGGASIWAISVPTGDYAAPIALGTYSATGVENASVSLSSVFGGITPELAAGTWTVNISDNSGGDEGSVTSATLTLTSVPEASTWSMYGLVTGVLGILVYRRRRAAVRVGR